MSKTDRIVMLLSIIGRGRSKSYMDMLTKNGIGYHLQCVGHGTAPSEMMDIFGLQSSDKDIIISFAPLSEVAAFSADLGKNLDTHSRYGGLLVITNLSAMNRLSAEIIYRRSESNGEKGADLEMKNEHKHHLIMVTVNQGYTDQVMQTAKRAGATGGTVIRARLAGAEQLDPLAGGDLQEEREIVLILAPVNISGQILADVNAEWGMKTAAKGTFCAIPVEKAFKI